MKKRALLYVLLTVAALAIIIASTAIASHAETYSGNCGAAGDNVAWSLDTGSGMLTISGNGAMADYACSYYDTTTAPWGVYSDSIKSVGIKNGVTNVGEYAFYNCDNLTMVMLSGSVTSIGERAFKNCDSIGLFSIPANVETIGDGAFEYCGSLTSISIPDKVTYLGENAFASCSSLSSLNIGKGVTKIGIGAFTATALTSVTIPDNVTEIGSYAFRGCESLNSATIPVSVKTFGNDVFDGCAAGLKISCECKSAAAEYAEKNGIATELTHDYSGISVVKPTYKDYGYTLHICSRCGDSYKTDPVDPIPLPDNPYGDVPLDAWYTAGVLYCTEKGYMSGTGTGTFSPGATLTRAMFVTILVKIDNADVSSYTGTPFKDVPTGKWYSKPVAWASAMGYAGGTGNGKFSPDAAMTRETLAQFFFNYSSKKGYDVSASADLSKFTDAMKISGWARPAMSWAVGSGLISGTSATTVSPKGSATRAQVAVIIMNYVEKIAVPAE